MSELVYCHLSPEGALVKLAQAEPTRVLLVAEASTSQKFKESVAYELVRGNCLYFLAWGSECEAWHDAIDIAIIEEFDFKNIPDERFVMTTWHDNEPLSEFLWFAKNSAFHPVVDLSRTVLLHVSHAPQEQKLMRSYVVA